MTMRSELHRRRLLTRIAAGVAAGVGVLAVGACDRLSYDERARKVLDFAERLTLRAQRLLLGSGGLAPEYTEADISPFFKPNGTSNPDDQDYQAHVRNNFTDWKLDVGGLVERPASLSLEDLRRLPSRTQITRHDCVEGWSCIGKWTGARLAPLLHEAGLKPRARFIVFHCADTLEQTPTGGAKYYESIDLADAFHPQTIHAYEMDGAVLPVAHGAPLRLRLERQLGYKMAKYVMRIEAVESFADIDGGRGGYWEDRGYEWYAGI